MNLTLNLALWIVAGLLGAVITRFRRGEKVTIVVHGVVGGDLHGDSLACPRQPSPGS